jgi:MoaA/NifB/PqqE/SkfB family radical SAM enzyme
MLKRHPAEKAPFPPVMVDFAVTRQCNLRCKHCYSSATDSPHQQELTTAEAKRVISEVAASGTRLITFDGGEPLMRPDIYELISYAKESGLHPMLGTNGTLLSTEAIDKLKKAGIGPIAISIHGPDAKSHDDFSGREGSWERSMAGIRNVASAGLPFQINTCLHHDNMDQFDSLVELAKKSGAATVEVFGFMPVGRGKDHPELALTAQERHGFVHHVIERQLHDELNYRCITLPQLLVEVDKTVAPKEDRRKFSRSCCGAGIRYCCIFYEGTVYPCTLLQKRAGNVRENTFQEIWERAEIFKTLRNRDKLGGKCKRCIYRYECGGARCLVFAKIGSLSKEDGYCWFKGKEELQPPIETEEAGCRYCGRKELLTCEECGTPLCEKHSFYCPLCHTPLCHPDVKCCFFQHDC